MKKKKKSLMYILLFPLLLVVLLQGILPFSMMLVSGVKNTMQKNAVDIDSNIVENHQVVLDNAWTANFRFKGEGISSADDFFYKPYELAKQNRQSDMTSMGYWSMPFILENATMDKHKMITYSVPLIFDGEIYGVLGMEVSTGYLKNSYLQVQDLAKDQNAGYMLAICNGEGIYRGIEGKGILYDTVTREQNTIELEKTKYSNLFLVKGKEVGSQKIYAVVSEMGLYGRHVTYENTQWVLCGFVTEDSIFAMGNKLYNSILTTIFFCALIGLLIMRRRRCRLCTRRPKF